MFSKTSMYMAALAAALLVGAEPVEAQSSNEGRRPKAEETRPAQRPEPSERPSLRRRPPKSTPARPDSKRPERERSGGETRGGPSLQALLTEVARPR